MSKTQKEKLEYMAIPLQLVNEISAEHAVTAINDSSSDVYLEKRKKEAKKPIYLKRV
jgi:hypothetical protein